MTTTEHNAFSTASRSGVRTNVPGGGSEQNSQPRLASEEADFRQVPSNAGAVDDLNAECGVRSAEPDGYPRSPGSKGGESSRAAAGLAAREAEVTREQVLSLLLCHDFNADTLAFLIRKDVHNVRSRCSELAVDEAIFFSGQYSSENNPNGIRTKVWTTRRPQFLTTRNAENTKR